MRIATSASNTSSGSDRGAWWCRGKVCIVMVFHSFRFVPIHFSASDRSSVIFLQVTKSPYMIHGNVMPKPEKKGRFRP